MIDPLDNVKIPDKSKIRRKPFYEDTINNGFSITVHYSPEDVADILSGKLDFDYSPEELAAFEEYRRASGKANGGN